jgi:inosine-uridine nucleoside N-ribohydrolase
MRAKRNRIPVILDTDIGGDIDDTWALAMMLKCPELDVKLVVSDTGDTTYRSKIIAKMLEIAKRTDVPVGVGRRFRDDGEFPQAPWVEGYRLSDYPGTVHEDGVGAIIDTIMNASEPITLICIGPVPNIGEALDREPRIVDKARFVGMHGSVYKGYDGTENISAECNVVNHTAACQKVFTASWDITITPLDTCGLVVLEGEKYQAVQRCPDPLIQAIMENYRIWLSADLSWRGDSGIATRDRVAKADTKSTTLFDTVAVYLAFSKEFLEMEDLGIRVSDDGYTLRDENAKRVHVAKNWRNLGAFEDFLVECLTSQK